MTDITAVAPTEAPAAPPAPEAAESDATNKTAREALLDHLGDCVEAGPQSAASIIAVLAAAGFAENTIEVALSRATERGLISRTSPGHYVLAPPKPKAPPAAAAPPPLAVAEADVELFTALLMATGGHVVVGQPRGTGITDLAMVKTMLQAGADLEQDILPAIRGHVGELAQRPLESWTAQWFVQGVAESHRRRVNAAKPAAAAITDAELLEKLKEASYGNVVEGPGIEDVGPIRVVLAFDVELDDILYTLRGNVSRRTYPGNKALTSWGEPRFLRLVAETYLRRTTVPAMVERWTKTASGTAVQRPEASAAISAP